MTKNLLGNWFSSSNQYNNDGHFIKGSMGSKMETGISFVKETQGFTIITNSENAIAAIQGKSGTKIVP